MIKSRIQFQIVSVKQCPRYTSTSQKPSDKDNRQPNLTDFTLSILVKKRFSNIQYSFSNKILLIFIRT